MKICGLQKTTLLDFPGHLAATVFTGGCNFRCPFCHNSELVTSEGREIISEGEIMEFLKSRSSVLEGVCITGGEPTLQPDLERFLKDIKSLGLSVKLDTNGFRPDTLKSLAFGGLLDYVAMDIKNSRERYGETAGVPGLDLRAVEESVSFLLEGTVSYEFRTTVVRELHREEDFHKIGSWVHGCSSYALQNYRDSDQVLMPGFHCCTADQMNSFKKILEPHTGRVFIRGGDF